MSTYRLALGTLTKAVIEADADAIVANFPRASARENWNVRCENLIDNYTRRAITLGGRVRTFGRVNLSPWTLIQSQTQVAYLDTEFFLGAPDAVVTILTLDVDKGVWRAFNVVMVRPQLRGGDGAQNNSDTFLTYTYNFLPAVEAADA